MMPIRLEAEAAAMNPGYYPNISIVLPLETETRIRSDLEKKLKALVVNAESLLSGKFSKAIVDRILEKLKTLIRHLNLYTSHRSIAIFVSPQIEKLLYFDVRVAENLAVNSVFRTRNILAFRQRNVRYLLLALRRETSRIYYAHSSGLVQLAASEVDIRMQREQVQQEVGEALLHIFCHKVDRELRQLLKEKQLPVFVMGEAPVLRRFKKVTANARSIISYVPVGEQPLTEQEMLRQMTVPLADWQGVVLRETLYQLQRLGHNRQLVYGIEDVWDSAVRNNIRLLVVEKGFKCGSPFFNDVVDTVIERVLESGGEVELVEDNVLCDYDHIAVVRAY